MNSIEVIRTPREIGYTRARGTEVDIRWLKVN